ncbi:ADP-ribosylation factor-like 10 [Aplochiton taeniatus]
MLLLRHISIAITAALAALGSALFIALNYFYRRRIWSPEAEYCMIKEEQEERVKRQVLVLGLDGAGKSSLLQGLGSTEREALPSQSRPTRGFNFLSLTLHACQLDFLEIGGGENLRRYWSEYIRKTHVLVYVVDASDRRRLPLAKEELHHLLRVDTQLPVVVLGSKQVTLTTRADYYGRSVTDNICSPNQAACERTLETVFYLFGEHSLSDNICSPNQAACERTLETVFYLYGEHSLCLCLCVSDLPNAMSASELREALCLGRLVEERRLVLLAVQLGFNGLVQGSTPDLQAIQELLLQLV